MAAVSLPRNDPGMVEVLIGFDRPESMSEAEMRDWLDHRARDGGPTLAWGRAAGPPTHHLLWVTAAPDSRSAEEDQIADLLLDMRLLGLRPTLMADTGGSELPEPWTEDG